MRRRGWLESVLLLAGFLAIDVWIWSHAGAVIYQSWENRAFEREVQEQTGTAPDRAVDVPAAATPARSGGRLGRLTIPRLGLQAMVREGVGEDTLSLALGHIPDTALPGQPGNVGVAGHRDTIFRALREIHKNDTIVFETRQARYVYRVEATEIVKPEQVSVLNAGTVRQLTLVTCYPFRYVGAAPDRFIVKARQVAPKVDSRRPPRSRKAWRGPSSGRPALRRSRTLPG